jgi:hypothetical protein
VAQDIVESGALHALPRVRFRALQVVTQKLYWAWGKVKSLLKLSGFPASLCNVKSLLKLSGSPASLCNINEGW